jgi:hypothetical protein
LVQAWFTVSSLSTVEKVEIIPHQGEKKMKPDPTLPSLFITSPRVS